MCIFVYLCFGIAKQRIQLHREGIRNRRFDVSHEANKKDKRTS